MHFKLLLQIPRAWISLVQHPRPVFTPCANYSVDSVYTSHVSRYLPPFSYASEQLMQRGCTLALFSRRHDGLVHQMFHEQKSILLLLLAYGGFLAKTLWFIVNKILLFGVRVDFYSRHKDGTECSVSSILLTIIIVVKAAAAAVVVVVVVSRESCDVKSCISHHKDRSIALFFSWSFFFFFWNF